MLQTERDMLLMEQRKQELLRKARIQQLFKEVERAFGQVPQGGVQLFLCHVLPQPQTEPSLRWLLREFDIGNSAHRLHHCT